MMDTGLLLMRLVIGLIFAAYGTQKLFGWFGGYGLQGTAGWMDSIGLKPGKLMALLAGLSELAGGLLLASGFLTPLAALLIAGTMVMAIVKVHAANGLWNGKGGYEYNLVLAATVIGIALIGPGQFALDAVLFS